MKKIVTLGLLLVGLFGAALPSTAAAEKKQKPNKTKQIEKTRRHLHHESMHRVHKAEVKREKSK